MSNQKLSKQDKVWSILQSVLIEGWHQGKLQTKTPYDYTLGTEEVSEWMQHKQRQILDLFGDELFPELLTTAKEDHV